MTFVYCFYYFIFVYVVRCVFFFFFKQKTAYEMRISDWSSDVCSSDLCSCARGPRAARRTGTAASTGSSTPASGIPPPPRTRGCRPRSPGRRIRRFGGRRRRGRWTRRAHSRGGQQAYRSAQIAAIRPQYDAGIFGRNPVNRSATEPSMAEASPPMAPEWTVSRWFNADGAPSLQSLRGRVVFLHAFQMLFPACVPPAVPQRLTGAAAFAATARHGAGL